MLEKTLVSPLDCKEIQPVNPKGNQSWLFIGRTDAEAETPILWPPKCEELTLWKRPWCWEKLKTRWGGDDRGWDGWMASPTWRTWGWVSSRSWWWTGRPGMLQSMGLQRVGHDWLTKLNWKAKFDYIHKTYVHIICGLIFLKNSPWEWLHLQVYLKDKDFVHVQLLQWSTGLMGLMGLNALALNLAGRSHNALIALERTPILP